MKKLFLPVFALIFLIQNSSAQVLSKDERMKWWREARFGMFIHWGVYAQWGGVYHGHKQARGGAEWIMNRAKIPVVEYQERAKSFNPTKYDPDALVRLAKEAGMKYIIITAKHHDGFALFNSKASGWDITDATAYGKDLLKPLADACKKHGIKLGFYYSQAQDWNNPGGSVARKEMREGWPNPDSAKIDAYTAAHKGHWDPAQETRTFDQYIDEVAVPQVKEILTNYGEIAVLWWDTPTNMTDEAALKLQALLKLQPNIITNDRLKRPNFPGDTKTPEQKIPTQAELDGQDWETCMTMNSSWGYKSWDDKWKSTETLIRNLIDIASKGGNYLLNIGPRDDGTIPQESIDRLKQIGVWMKVNSETIYASKPSPLAALPWGRVTRKETPTTTTLYFSVFEWPKDGKLFVPTVKNEIVSAKLLAGGDLKVKSEDGGIVMKVPDTAPDPIATVIKVEFKGQMENVNLPGKSKMKNRRARLRINMNKQQVIKSLCFLLLLTPLCLSAKDVNVKDFGAVGDGKTLNSEALQKAINECNKSGGGKVLFPEGIYLSGTIALKNNVTLHFQKGARLLGSTNIEDYKNLDPFTEGLGIDVGWALLVAIDLKNIGIEGEGAIDGQGSKLKAEHILKDTRPEGQRWGRRPFLVRIVRCDGVTVKDITLNYAAAWTSHYFQSKNITIENVKIVSVGVAHNDGIGIDGCQDVRIKNCDVVSGDDALVFKTTSSKMGCKNIVVSGMRLKSNQAGIKMGTESMAPFEDIKISNCHIYDTKNGGIKLFTVDGAHLRNVEISNIMMDEVRTPMLFRLGSRLNVFRKTQDTKQPTGTFENVVIRNVKAKAADSAQLKPPSGILITGVPGHYITNLTLENIEIDLLGSGSADIARHKVPEAIDQYPEVKTFGPIIPAYGVWARHVKGLKLKNITFRIKQNDLRPVFICEDGKDIELTGWNVPETSGGEAIIRLENVEGAAINKMNVKGFAQAFVRVEGKESKNVKLSKNKTPGIKNTIETSAEVKLDMAKAN